MKVKDLLRSVVNFVLIHTDEVRNFTLKYHYLHHWCINVLECRIFSSRDYASPESFENSNKFITG